MFVDGLAGVLDLLAPLVEKLGVEPLESDEAAGVVECCVEIERLAAAARMTATRVVSSDRWRAEGFPSAASWMASMAGLPVGPAIKAIETMRLLDDLPATATAFRSGRLSLPQATEVAEVAANWPHTEQHLLHAAEVMCLQGLRDECRRVRASAEGDPEEHYRRLRRGRYLRSWTDRDGAVRLSGRFTPDDAARLLGDVDRRCGMIVAEARAGGWFESTQAHRADALVELAQAGSPRLGGAGEAAGSDRSRTPSSAGPAATIHVWVDYEALIRGHPIDGERCEIPGIGPIPVSVARRLANDAYLKMVVTKGLEITTVAHGGRTIPAHLRTALECRDPVCIVPGCEGRRNLQIDHRQPVAAGGETSLANTARLCPRHHYEKSHLGYRYRGGPGTWEWIPPESAPP